MIEHQSYERCRCEDKKLFVARAALYPGIPLPQID